jgi:hypothetical protein
MTIRGAGRAVVEYLKTNSTIKWLMLPLISYWILCLLFPADFLIRWLSWILVVVAAGVCSTYAISVWHGLTNSGPMPRYTHLALGIFIGWLSIVMNRSWAGMIRLYPLEMWMRESYFISFYVWTSIMAAVFHMTAPGAINGVVPTANWIKIGIAVMVGIMLGVLVGVAIAGMGQAAIVDFDLLSYLIRAT